jgi:hypothetical protein
MDSLDFLPELTKKEEKYVTRVQKQIHYCSYDQSYDSGEVVWIFGDKIELTDLLYNCNIPEENWDKVIAHLSCPSCGHSNFELVEIVGLQTKYDREIEEHTKKAQKKYGKQIKDFELHLEKNPMLGYQHTFGRKLYREINDKGIPSTTVKGDFFRARAVRSSEVFTSKKMSKAPPGKPTEGRFNHSGQSHLYLASDKETALKEIATTEDPLLAWCQIFQIGDDIHKILDLSFEWMDLSLSTSTLLLSLKMYRAIDRTEGNKEYWRPDYFLTRYIMDCALMLGFEGIKYNSTKGYSGYNIVIFNPESHKISSIGTPIVESFIGKEKSHRDFLDLKDF